LTNEWNSK